MTFEEANVIITSEQNIFSEKSGLYECFTRHGDSVYFEV